MPIGELIGKGLGTLVAAGALVAGGVFVLAGPHAYNDYLNTLLGVVLLLLGLLVLGIGGMLVLGVYYDARAKRREEALHVTPRGGPPAPPPAWGMGDIGRPGSGVVQMSAHGPRGSVRVMSIRPMIWDAPLLVAGLLLVTGLLVWFLAPAFADIAH